MPRPARPHGARALADSLPGARDAQWAAPKLSILIADDEAEFRANARTALEGIGFSVTEAQSGRQVLRHAADDSPGAIVIDLAMPDGEGIETIQALHSGGYPGVIVAMSGAFASPLLRTAQLLGANGCIAKPLRKGELSHLVAKLLVERWSPADPN